MTVCSIHQSVGVELARRYGARVGGLTIPDLMDHLDVSKDAARRFILRLVRAGVLERTDERRRRIEFFGERYAGAGGVVYRTRSTWRRRPVMSCPTLPDRPIPR